MVYYLTQFTNLYSNIFRNIMINMQRNKSYFQHNYCASIETAINNQIQAEQQAAQEYLSIAVNFLHPSVSRLGAGGFFMRMYDEEISHMQEFIQYQLLRGGYPVINGITQPDNKNNYSLLNAFENALQLEKNITKLLEDLICIADSAKDLQCIDFVTSLFLKEQMYSINQIAHHVTNLRKLGENEYATYNYDLHLSKLYPYKFKSIISR